MWLSGCSSPRGAAGDAIFQAASLTKPVVAFAALRLVREGRLDLQAPVSRYLPVGYAHRKNPFGGPSAREFDQVTAQTLTRIPVSTLLNHSSGLPNWTSGMPAPEFEPGQRWQYSGEGYLLLQSVIAAVMGKDIGRSPRKASSSHSACGTRGCACPTTSATAW